MKNLLKKQKEEVVKEDNIQVPTESVPQDVLSERTPSAEVEELEISQSDYNKFLQWQRQQADIDAVKKKVADSDPSYLINILKTLGVALVPALISAVQRAATKTLEQKNQETRSESSIAASAVSGNGQWDPLSQPKFSTA